MDSGMADMLYDTNVWNKVKLEDWPKVTFNPPISLSNPGEGLVLRALKKCDYEKGFPKILGQLTQVGDVSEEKFLAMFEKMKRTDDTYYVSVIEDVTTNEIIGAATLLVEQKFIHDCAKRGRVEDVVVDARYRGKQLGKLLVAAMTVLAKHLMCYKLTLDCRDEMVAFYEGLGFVKEPKVANYLTIRMDSGH